MNAPLEEIRSELAKQLERANLDFDRVRELLSELSKLDPASASFSVNATIIRRLGRELVAAQETALAELVKNAFDADAEKVTVTFSAVNKRGGRLVIEDNGSGMTPDQFRQGFLRLASDEKEKEPVSPRFRRKRAGQKGIGRFAVERLGKKLLLITATENESDATEISIDWDDYERSVDLASLRHAIKRIPKPFLSGTRLVIDGLREAWTHDAIEAAEAYITDLKEPTYFEGAFPAEKRTRQKGEFEVEFAVLDGVKPIPVQQPERQVVNSALAIVEATVSPSAEWKIRIIAKAFAFDRTIGITDLGDEDRPKWTFSALQSVRLRAAYFIPGSEMVANFKAAGLNRILRTRGGIRIYRNSFRVPPYGNQGDDWLKLDHIEASRKILVPVKRTNWVGYVSITDPENKLASETSSREGLIQNEFFKELIKFTQGALLRTAEEVGKSRGKKIYASDPGFGQTKSERAQKAVKTAAKLIHELTETRKRDLSTYAKEQITDSTISELKVELEKAVKDTGELTGEIAILRVFASVGMSVLVFSHEVKGLLANMLGAINASMDDDQLPAKTRSKLKQLKGMVDRLQHLTNFYESTGSAAADRTLHEVDALSMMNGFVESFASQAAKRGIELLFEGDATLPVRVVLMHEAEFSSILINLYTNAIKAIQRGKHNKDGKILMRHSRIRGREIIEVLDTGVGIAAADKDKVFKPFFTTTPVKRALRPGDAEMYGTGLGLTITRDSVESARGTIDVVFPPPKPYSTCIRIELPHIAYAAN